MIKDYIFFENISPSIGYSCECTVTNSTILQLEIDGEGTNFQVTVKAKIDSTKGNYYPVGIVADKQYKILQEGITEQGLYKIELLGFEKINITCTKKDLDKDSTGTISCKGKIISI